MLNARCVGCHNATNTNNIDLSPTLDVQRIPKSYDSLIRGQWVNYFNMNWHLGHTKAEPLTFGTVKSRLFTVLSDGNHAQVQLRPEESQAIKCWIDLNCPLWPDYTHRSERPAVATSTK